MLAKSAEESLFVVHENGVGYSTKWIPVRYCQIAIFQGFRVAVLGLESGPENSRLGSGENGAARYHPPRSIGARRHWKFALSRVRNLRLRAGVPTLATGRQKITLAWLIIGNRPLKTVQRRGPKFHAIQILVQSLNRFGEIANDLVFRRFRHGIGPYAQSTHFCPCKTKRLLAVWFQCRRVRMTDWQTNLSGTVRLQRCLVAAVPTDLTPLR